MSTSAISSYLTTANSGTANAASTSTVATENSLDMSDFINLLVAQLQNQDMNNTTDTSEMMAQMAQYSMVQAITDMNEQSKIASSFGLIGKGVTVSSTDSGGNKTYDSGVVDGVSIRNGAAEVVVNGTAYSMDDISEVFDSSLLDT